MISFNYSWQENHQSINALTIPRKTDTNLNWQLNWRNKSRLLMNWSHLLCYRTFFGRSIAFNTYLIFIFKKQRTLTSNNKKIHMKPVIKLFPSRILNVVWKKNEHHMKMRIYYVLMHLKWLPQFQSTACARNRSIFISLLMGIVHVGLKFFINFQLRIQQRLNYIGIKYGALAMIYLHWKLRNYCANYLWQLRPWIKTNVPVDCTLQVALYIGFTFLNTVVFALARRIELQAKTIHFQMKITLLFRFSLLHPL